MVFVSLQRPYMDVERLEIQSVGGIHQRDEWSSSFQLFLFLLFVCFFFFFFFLFLRQIYIRDALRLLNMAPSLSGDQDPFCSFSIFFFFFFFVSFIPFRISFAFRFRSFFFVIFFLSQVFALLRVQRWEGFVFHQTTRCRLDS